MNIPAAISKGDEKEYKFQQQQQQEAAIAEAEHSEKERMEESYRQMKHK